MVTAPQTGRATRWILLATALGVAIVILLGWGLTRRHNEPQPRTALPASVPPRAHVEIAIEGMDCVMCAAGLQNELRSLPGVSRAEVRYQAGTATIEYDPKLVGPERFSELVKKSGFTVARQVSGGRGD